MNRLLLPVAVFAASALPIPAGAQTAPGPALRPAKAAERTAAAQVIQAQLKAFAKNDYKTAITYQSADLKKNFASPQAFRAMMVRTYPEFAHYKSVVFGPMQAEPSGAHLLVPAAVTGQDGITIRAFYILVREGKVYRVDGVQGGAQIPADLASPSKSV